VIAVTPGKTIRASARPRVNNNRELLDGKNEIAEFCVPHVGKMSLHTDLAAARVTISRLKTLEKDYGVRVVLAHDVSWMGDAADEVLLSLLDDHMKDARTRIAQGEIP
jgi:hypothetical protein